MQPKALTITIRYVPKPRKAKLVRETVEDAIDELFMERLSELVECADSWIK